MQGDFEMFVAGSAGALRNLALALTNNGADADDLVQVAMERMSRVWSHDIDHPLAYARVVMMRAYTSERRRARWRREVIGAVPDSRWDGPREAQSDDRLVLFQALADLPRRQREAVVLRYLEDMPLTEVAELMGCSEGNVKRSAFDGLRALRSGLDAEFGIVGRRTVP